MHTQKSDLSCTEFYWMRALGSAQNIEGGN